MMRTAATTAVVVGTASVVGKAMAPKPAPAAAPAAAEPQVVYVQAPPAEVAAPAPAPAIAAPAATLSMDDKIDQIQKLSELQKQGILTPEEFSAQKAKILAM